MLRALLLVSALAFAACSPASNSTPSDAIYVGVLEEKPGAVVGEPSRRVVRAAFVKEGETWSALPELAPMLGTTSWTIAHQGAALGAITTSSPTVAEGGSSAGLQEIDTGQDVPIVGERSEEFSGWQMQPLQRPLVASTQANVADPDTWRARALTAPEIERLHQDFRARFANVTNCASPEENVARAWQYSENDFVHEHSAASSEGRVVASLRLNNYRCDGPIEDADAFGAQTFAISPAGEVSFLGPGLLFLDAGDFDNDGASELVFVIDGYNRGGYALYSADLANHAEFAFSYH